MLSNSSKDALKRHFDNAVEDVDCPKRAEIFSVISCVRLKNPHVAPLTKIRPKNGQ